jgi:HD-GYP domain-containing protein (c-di-GMP phosphodiesterase class II)
VAVVVAGMLAAGAAIAVDVARLLRGLEQQSIAQRFEQRDPRPAANLLVVAIDDKTFADLSLQWPFPRHWHGRAIDRLRRAGARAIVYDVQFTEPTVVREDNALIRAVGRARNVVLATAETDEHGRTNVLGGAEVLERLGAHVGASNLPEGMGGVLQRFEHTHGGLPTLATVVVRLLGREPAPASFEDGRAWIDFHGPPGTIDTVSFSDLVTDRVDSARLRGRIVVVGAASPTLQDVHTTPTGDALMSGAEIEANAIDTAIRGLPLRGVPLQTELLLVLVLALLPALISVRWRALVAVLASPAIAAAFLVAAQFAFDRGRILPVATPLFALALGTVTTITAGYATERRWRHRVTRRNNELEDAVRERTAELRKTQLEVIHRLAQATESRDEETGLHLERISRMCERVGLAMGMTATEAETLRNASLLHDVGKIGVPDAVLLQPGALSPDHRELMCRHTTLGGAILAGSSAPVIRMAEAIALTHHEHWDGSGYPAGLRGEAIPLPGRICAVCDVFDALLSRRPYKEPWRLEEALAELRRERGRHFDPAVLDAFLGIVDDLDPSLLAPDGPVHRLGRASAERPKRNALATEKPLVGRVDDGHAHRPPSPEPRLRSQSGSKAPATSSTHRDEERGGMPTRSG